MGSDRKRGVDGEGYDGCSNAEDQTAKEGRIAVCRLTGAGLTAAPLAAKHVSIDAVVLAGDQVAADATAFGAWDVGVFSGRKLRLERGYARLSDYGRLVRSLIFDVVRHGLGKVSITSIRGQSGIL